MEGEGVFESVRGVAALREFQVAARERAVGGVRAVFHDAFLALLKRLRTLNEVWGSSHLTNDYLST